MKLRWAEPVLPRIGSVLVRALAATWRIHVRDPEPIRDDGKTALLVVAWHSRILPLLYHYRGRGIVVLISRHRDGGYLADVAERWGYRAVRGSSKRGGAAGLLGIVRELQSGAIVAVTPDGPQGPAEKVKPGAIAAAQHAGAPIIPLGVTASRAWWVRSWDRFCIPKPFARIEIAYGTPIFIGPGKEAAAVGAATVERAMQQLVNPA